MRRQVALREKAQSLRKQGYSYTEILKDVPVSLSSISLWCHDISLSSAQKERLHELSIKGSAKARKQWVEVRKEQKAEQLKIVTKETKREIGKLSRRERFIAGVLLYAGEGDKTGERVGVSNANPHILRFALDWLCDFSNLDRESFKVHLYLHVGLSEKKAKHFWAKVLRISEQQFQYVYRPIPRPSHKGNVHKFGVCSVRANNKKAHRRIMGWIKAVLHNDNLDIPG